VKRTITALLLLLTVPLEAAEVIEDNLFLLEEAYNQEPGVIQHIQTFSFDPSRRGWRYDFTQEWPIPGRRHQLSYTIPVERADDQTEAFGDTALHYRFQALDTPRLAAAPELSLILPTAQSARDAGRQAWGIEPKLPVSWRWSENWVSHWNIGATRTWGARSIDGPRNDLWDADYGLALVRNISSRFDALVELSGGWEGTARETGGTAMQPYLVVNPGIRFAFNCPSGLQIVPGLAYTLGVGPSDGLHAVFFYLSFEHPLWHPSRKS